ncbi:MAG: hypothetical protein Kow0031_18270 [Anaerolineae bacterium]
MKFRRNKLLVGIVVALFLLTATLVVAAPAPLWTLLLGEPLRSGTDPLSAGEVSAARQLVQQSGALSAQLAAGGRSELLLVERHQEPKAVRQQGAWPRRADYYLYDYDTDTLLHSVINLETGAVDEMSRAQDVQLPLTDNEIGQALAIALADAPTRAAIEQEFRRVSGTPLNDPARQLQVHALVFRAAAMPGNLAPAFAGCGRQRCGQLILSTPDNVLINIVPIVNLSARQLAGLDEFITE